MLSAALEGNGARQATLEKVPGYVEQVIASVEGSLPEAPRGFANAGKLVVLGRGFNYSTAFEVALKIKETCYFIAEPYSVADLLHGPGRDESTSSFPSSSSRPAARRRPTCPRCSTSCKSAARACWPSRTAATCCLARNLA